MRKILGLFAAFAISNPVIQVQAQAQSNNWKNRLKNVQCVLRLAQDSSDTIAENGPDIPMLRTEYQEGDVHFSVYTIRENSVFIGSVSILPHQLRGENASSVVFAVSALVTQSKASKIVDEINGFTFELTEGVPQKFYSTKQESIVICTLPVLDKKN